MRNKIHDFPFRHGGDNAKSRCGLHDKRRGYALCSVAQGLASMIECLFANKNRVRTESASEKILLD